MPADTPDAFDPYHKWLGIPRDQRPVTHYQLLGISPGETDVEVIEDAATRQSTHVRTYQLGPHADICQRGLNEIAQARRTLLDAQKRKEYDATLPKAAKPKPASPRPRSAPVEIEVEPAPTATRKPTPSSGKGWIAGMVAGGAALLVAAVGGTLWLSQPETPVKVVHTPKNPPVVSNEKKSAVVVEPKKSPEPKQVEPARIEPDKTPPVVAKGDDSPIQEHEWRTGMPRTTVLRRNTDGIAILSGISGHLEGWGENFVLGVNRDGDWSINARANSQYRVQALFLPKKIVDVFDLERTTSVPLYRSPRNPPTPYPLCPESEGICWICGMGGLWGGNEGLRVYVEDGMWKFVGISGGSDVNGEAVVCRFAKSVDRTKIRQSEVEWRPSSGALKLLDVKDGFCVLTGIEGNIRGSRQRIELTVRDGAWWLEGNDERANHHDHLVVHALRVSLTGKQPALTNSKERIVREGPAAGAEPAPAIDPVKRTDAPSVEERTWHNGMPHYQLLIRGSDGIAVFGGVKGGIVGGGEYVAASANKAGDWFFEASCSMPVSAFACCVSGLPAGFFDPQKTTTVAFDNDIGEGDRAPLELCSEDEGICWIGAITGSYGERNGVCVRREDGKWRFTCSRTGRSDATGEAVVCRFGKGVDRDKLRLSEVEWSPADGPLKLLDVKDGFCVLTEINGALMSGKRAFQLTVKDGAWWLDGKDEGRKLRIRALRVSLTGNLPKLSGQEPMVAKTGTPAESGPKKDVAKPGRLPVPDATAQTVALKKLHGLLKTPGLKATAKEWTSHTTFVFGLGKETKDDLNLRYVALREAFELSYPLGDPETAELALAMLDEEYSIDSLGLKAAALSLAGAKPPVPSSQRILAERCDDVAREALAAEEFDRAGKVASLGASNAALTKIPAISAYATKRQNQVRDLAKAFKAYKTAATDLRTQPDDPKACATAGAYLALGEGNWDAGLKLLAKGDDEPLRMLSQKDMSQPTEVDARRSLFEAWADVVERQRPGYKSQAAVRASYWYRQLDGAVLGIERLKLDKRLGEVAKSLPAPLPTARWTFDGNARDVLGDLHCRNAAKLKLPQGRLSLGDRQEETTVPLPFDVRERTLEVWFYLTTSTGGGDIFQIRRIANPEGKYDGLCIREGRAYPASTFGQRSRELEIAPEKVDPSELVHVAAVHAADHTVTLYRNGKQLSPPFHNDLNNAESQLKTYRKGDAEMRFGGGMPLDIEEARLYTRALSADEIAMSYLTFKK